MFDLFDMKRIFTSIDLKYKTKHTKLNWIEFERWKKKRQNNQTHKRIDCVI